MSKWVLIIGAVLLVLGVAGHYPTSWVLSILKFCSAFIGVVMCAIYLKTEG